MAMPSVMIVQNVFNFVSTQRGHMLRRQHQRASSDTATARVGSGVAASLAVTPAATSTFSK